VDVRTALVVSLPIVVACGNTAQQIGKVAGDASGDGTVQDAEEAGGSEDGGADDALGDSPPPVQCSITGSSELTGSQQCYQTVTETCDDGNAYTVSCTCPAATCSCARGPGDAGRIFATTPYAGCPTTCADGGSSTAAMFAGCGVPY
jgi:hypothetical protein